MSANCQRAVSVSSGSAMPPGCHQDATKGESAYCASVEASLDVTDGVPRQTQRHIPLRPTLATSAVHTPKWMPVSNRDRALTQRSGRTRLRSGAYHRGRTMGAYPPYEESRPRRSHRPSRWERPGGSVRPAPPMRLVRLLRSTPYVRFWRFRLRCGRIESAGRRASHPGARYDTSTTTTISVSRLSQPELYARSGRAF
jgi:hypothetical protein